MLTWNDAPKDATHQHAQSHMFYKVENGLVYVWSKKGGWTKSKVAANSTALLPKPTPKQETNEMTEQPKVQVMEFKSLDEVMGFLAGEGVDEADIARLAASIRAAENEQDEVECNCEGCTEVAKLEAELAEVCKQGIALSNEGKRMATEGDIAGSLLNLSKAMELAARKAELEEALEALKGSRDEMRKDRVAEIDAVVDQVVEHVSHVVLAKNEEDFRMYAGVTIAALRDMGMLPADGE